ncbi:MAG: DUF2279 domain-containing protein [Flavisolibacter sp.]
MIRWRVVFFIFLLFTVEFSHAQQYALPPSPVYNSDRLKKVIISEAALGVVASVGLYLLWYKKFPRSRFHFFNDNREWMQVDKVGHMTTAYTIAVIQNDLMRACGVKPGTSIAIGSLTALGYMSIIEIMDGFSTHWGFSKGDMLANILGTGLFAAQQQWWKDQRISLKFSYHASPFAKYNPGELGNNWKSRLLKDYNGQAYWLSFNIKSFLSQKSSFPNWANVAFGYGAEGMTGANDNPTTVNGNSIPSFKRYRQFYIAPDADLFRIQSSNFYNDAAYIMRLLKIPSPALEFNTLNKWKFHPFYY